MDIVVRTPHGDADVSIASQTPTTTVGDVVAAVTGQAVPRLVLVDGSPVDANAALDDVALLMGSVVTSQAPVPSGVATADVDLVQIAGHGAGRVSTLGPGRYRIGPGRRSAADELAAAPVERAVFELVIERSGASAEVTVVPEAPGVAIDGDELDGARRWHSGTLTIGSRAFQLDVPVRSDRVRPQSTPDPDGMVAFSRPPRRMPVPARRPVVDAIRDATVTAPALWERRPGQPDAFTLPIGVRTDDTATVDIDLASNQAVAISGSERFRGGLVRSLVVEAVTVHGPADLDVVVLTRPDRLAQWDWAKWLVHLRVDGTPAIWSSRHDIARWTDAIERGAVGATADLAPHLTMVILDDPGLWGHPDSPIRSIVSGPPDSVRLIALCDDRSRPPAVCSLLLAERDDGLARVHSFARPGHDETIRPALTEPDVAGRVARALAPLIDVELTPRSAKTNSADRVELSELIHAADADAVLSRWAARNAPATAVLGRRGDELVDVPTDGDVTVVVGPSMGDAFDVAATSLIAQCVECSPDALWIAPLPFEPSARAELLWRLPHATAHHDFDAVIEPRRLLARLRAVLAHPHGPARIVLVADAARSAATASGDRWLEALADGVRTVSGLAIVVVTDHPDVANFAADTVVHVERRHDVPGTTRRVAHTATADGSFDEIFTPLQPSAATAVDLDLRPFVVGRALTPLERRIEQLRAQTANAPHPAFDTVATVLIEAAARREVDPAPGVPGGRTVVPPPMPTRVELGQLFDDAPGDGVPIGLVDDPTSAGLRVQWWQPGSGSMLVFGSRRSGMEQVLATILLGTIDRFSASDVRLVVVEGSAARRRALAGVDRPMRVVAPDRPEEVAGAFDEIAAEVDRGPTIDPSTRPAGPRLVVLIGDLVHLRRRYAGHPAGPRIDEVLTRAAAAGSGVDVIAGVADLTAAGPFATEVSKSLVGASSDARELATLGVEQPSELDGIAGRCRSFPGDELVQVALADTTIEVLLARRSIGDRT